MAVTNYYNVYVKARHYSHFDRGRTTRDPLWPLRCHVGMWKGSYIYGG